MQQPLCYIEMWKKQSTEYRNMLTFQLFLGFGTGAIGLELYQDKLFHTVQ